MKFTLLDTPQEYITQEWRSEDEHVSIVSMPIVGAMRVQVWVIVTKQSYPDILGPTWDTPSEYIGEIVEDIMGALAEIPFMCPIREIDRRLSILMYEWYGDIYDGVKCRIIDRYHPDYNPHANPWWDAAVELRRGDEGDGIARHTTPLKAGAPMLCDVMVEILHPQQAEKEAMQQVEDEGEPQEWVQKPEERKYKPEVERPNPGLRSPEGAPLGPWKP